jgi:hypothetical protein
LQTADPSNYVSLSKYTSLKAHSDRLTEDNRHLKLNLTQLQQDNQTFMRQIEKLMQETNRERGKLQNDLKVSATRK